MKQVEDTMEQDHQGDYQSQELSDQFCRGRGAHSLSGDFAVRPGGRNACSPRDSSSECQAANAPAGKPKPDPLKPETGEGICGIGAL